MNAGDLVLAEQEIDVREIVDDSIARYEKLVEEKEITISIDVPPREFRIVNDPNKIARIVQNILHNAIKFTPKGRIAIKARRSPQQGAMRLEILDSGLGIPEKQIERMFQPFQQLDSSLKREYSGLGLGLTVAHRLSEFVGGGLEIQSEPGVGTRVLLSIPSRPAAGNGGLAGQSN
jgi:signal transduction histidine kinase